MNEIKKELITISKQGNNSINERTDRIILHVVTDSEYFNDIYSSETYPSQNVYFVIFSDKIQLWMGNVRIPLDSDVTIQYNTGVIIVG